MWAVAVLARYPENRLAWALVNYRDKAWGCNTLGRWARWFPTRDGAEQLAVLVRMGMLVEEARIVTKEEWQVLCGAK